VGNNEQDLGTRSRTRKNVIGNSPHRDEYHRLLVAGWSSYALEKYAMHRFGEDIPARTFRLYKTRKKIIVAPDPLKELSLDDIPDVLQERIRIVQLQKERIGIDWTHEQSMRKLFNTTGREIQLYSQLLTDLRSDLQDLGFLPRPGAQDTVPREADDNSPRYRTLGDAFGVVPELERDLAKVLHLNLNGHLNGHSNGEAV
jgi:hypothetical protein